MNFRIVAFLGLALASMAGTAHAQNVSDNRATLPGPFGPPSWDTIYPAKERFLILSQFGNNAVLDRETGLVWERAPASTTDHWAPSMVSCRHRIIANRKGWRMPSYEEFSTLVDAGHSGPDLPPNNPFQNFTPTDLFWSSTSAENIPAQAFLVRFNLAADTLVSDKTTGSYRAWCVRGGQATQNPF